MGRCDQTAAIQRPPRLHIAAALRDEATHTQVQRGSMRQGGGSGEPSAGCVRRQQCGSTALWAGAAKQQRWTPPRLSPPRWLRDADVERATAGDGGATAATIAAKTAATTAATAQRRRRRATAAAATATTAATATAATRARRGDATLRADDVARGRDPVRQTRGTHNPLVFFNTAGCPVHEPGGGTGTLTDRWRINGPPPRAVCGTAARHGIGKPRLYGS